MKRIRGMPRRWTATVLGCLLTVLCTAWAAPARATVLYALDSGGILWQLDTAGNAGAGAWTSYTMNTTNGVFHFAHGIDVDADGNAYVANTGWYGSNEAISKVTISGTTATVSNFPVGYSTNGPRDLVVAGDYLYISDSSHKQVVRCKLDGSGGGTVIGGPDRPPFCCTPNSDDNPGPPNDKS